MTSVVRYTAINGGLALLTTALANNGDEFASQKVKRTFLAADVGTGAGQTRDATNPAVGCLVAQFTGSRIRDIINLQLWKNVVTNTTSFRTLVVGATTDTLNLGVRVSYNAVTGVSSIYILDKAAGAGGQIVADSWVTMDVLLGDSTSTTLIPAL